jgi:hypothetical protein
MACLQANVHAAGACCVDRALFHIHPLVYHAHSTQCDWLARPTHACSSGRYGPYIPCWCGLGLIRVVCRPRAIHLCDMQCMLQRKVENTNISSQFSTRSASILFFDCKLFCILHRTNPHPMCPRLSSAGAGLSSLSSETATLSCQQAALRPVQQVLRDWGMGRRHELQQQQQRHMDCR